MRSVSLEVERPSNDNTWRPPAIQKCSTSRSATSVPKRPYGDDFRYGLGMSPDEHAVRGLDLAYCRVSTTKQSLERQLDAIRAAGILDERIFTDKKTPSPFGVPPPRKPLPVWCVDV